VGSVQRELKMLTAAGLVKESAVGKHVFYSINRSSPVFPELRLLVAKTTGMFKKLTDALAPLAPKIELAFVYGSVASGTETADSDIDLMIVGGISLDELLDALAPVERHLHRPVNPIIYTREDLERKLHGGNHFLRSLQNSDKVYLIGGEDGFIGAGATRLVQT
jgi:predicted nucleotidyltransferase